MHDWRLRAFAVVALSTSIVLACRDGGDGAPPPASIEFLTECPSREAQAEDDIPDVLSALRCPGYVTYVRYSANVPHPWFTRAVAWIDHEHDRMRHWTITASDSSRNPDVCTTITMGNKAYGCLPFLGEALPLAWLTPRPVKHGDELRFPLPFSVAPFSVALVGQPEVEHGQQWGVAVKKYAWDVALPPELQAEDSGACPREEEPAYRFEYAVDGDSLPVSELLVTSCNGHDESTFGNVYHEVRFLDPQSLPQGFFDPGAARDEMTAAEVSAFERLYGGAYWLGYEVGPYSLASVELCGEGCLRFGYVAESGEVFEDEGFTFTEYNEFTLAINAHWRGSECPTGESIESAVPGGKMCEGRGGEYAASWRLDALDITLSEDDYQWDFSPEELRAIAGELRPYDGPAAEGKPPFLTMEDARELVADALDVVCPEKWLTVHEYRDSVAFEYDEAAGEWRGQFGPLGEWTVTDPGDPVAIPVAGVERLEQTGGSYAAGYASCALEAEEEAKLALSGEPPPYEDALAQMRSYRYRLQIKERYSGSGETEQLSWGAYVAPDRFENRFAGEFDGAPSGVGFGYTVIGGQSWLNLGTGWHESSGDVFGVKDKPLPLADLRGLDIGDLGSLESAKETVDGVPATRYEIRREDVRHLGERLSLQSRLFEDIRSAEDLPAELHVTIWLAEDGGWPVRMVISASGQVGDDHVDFQYTLDITDVNDPTITIEPPPEEEMPPQ